MLCVIIVAVFIVKKESGYPNKFSCLSSFTRHNATGSFHLSMQFIFKKNSGIISVTGHSEADIKHNFSRIVSFNYTREDDVYHMTSNKNIALPDNQDTDNNSIATYIPTFFIDKDQEIYMRIVKQKSNYYLFFIGTIPSFICKANDKKIS